MAAPSWFNVTDYMNSKLEVLNSTLAADSQMTMLGLQAAFAAAGYDVNNPDSLWSHFEAYGQFEGVSPTKYFDADQYLYNKAMNYYGKNSDTQVTTGQIENVASQLEAAGMSAWQHYTMYGAAEGVNPSTSFDAYAYCAAKATQLNAISYNDVTTWDANSVLAFFASNNIAPLVHYLNYGHAEIANGDFAFTPSPVYGGMPGQTFELTAGRDVLYGTTADDQFNGLVAGDLNNGDVIDGGMGYDTIEAVVGDNTMVYEPKVQNVEKIVLQAQDDAGATGDDNYPDQDASDNVQVDLGDVLGQVDTKLNSGILEGLNSNNQGTPQGLSNLVNKDSRADLIVEDVRSNSTDMTITWQDGDAGDTDGSGGTDFEVYFTDQYLKAEDSATSGTLAVRLMDVTGGDTKGEPFDNNPYNVLVVSYHPDGGSAVKLRLELEVYNDATKAAATGDPNAIFNYDDLLAQFQAAIQKLVDAGTVAAGAVTATMGPSFTGIGSAGTTTFTYPGNEIILSATGGTLTANFSDGDGWEAEGSIPPTSAFVTTVTTAGSESCPLIQTNIELDNVGRVQWTDASDCNPNESIWGSQAGDMIVGGMSGRSGIERFDVKVDRGSWISSLESTNNTLRLVTVASADINGDGYAGNVMAEANDTNVGQLFIGASQESTQDDMESWTIAPGLLAHDGLTDVKAFSAVGYGGMINVGARFTNEGYEKYLHDVDGLDTVYDEYTPQGDFQYDLGTQGDIMNMQLHGGMSADRDFKINLNGNDGNDVFSINFANYAMNGVGTQMTDNQVIDSGALRNVMVNGGNGNDTIWSWGEGAVVANGGEGDDAIYVGQNGNPVQNEYEGITTTGDRNAVWAFNLDTHFLSDRIVDWNATGAQASLNDFQSTTANLTFTDAAIAATNTLYVTVNFKGETNVVAVSGATASAAGTISASTDAINKAIISAIENDPVLKEVLIAKDGAGYGLLIESLIDGDMSSTDLQIGFSYGSTDATATKTPVTPDSSNPGTLYESLFAANTAETATNAVFSGPTVYAGSIDLSAMEAWYDTGAGVVWAAGDTITLTINGSPVTYTLVGTETFAQVFAGLYALLGPGYVASGTMLQYSGLATGVTSLSYAGNDGGTTVPGGSITPPTPTASAPMNADVVTYDFSTVVAWFDALTATTPTTPPAGTPGTLAAGDMFSFTIGGVTFTTAGYATGDTLAGWLALATPSVVGYDLVLNGSTLTVTGPFTGANLNMGTITSGGNVFDNAAGTFPLIIPNASFAEDQAIAYEDVLTYDLSAILNAMTIDPLYGSTTASSIDFDLNTASLSIAVALGATMDDIIDDLLTALNTAGLGTFEYIGNGKFAVQGDYDAEPAGDLVVTDWTFNGSAVASITPTEAEQVPSWIVNMSSLNAGNIVTFEINGVRLDAQYTVPADGTVSTDGAKAAWLSGILGNAYTVEYNGNETWTIYGSTLNAKAPAITYYTGLSQVDGTDTGTHSINHVDMSAGNDVITLNANTSTLDAWFDTLEISGAFGNDTVFNFDDDDKIEFMDSTGVNNSLAVLGGATVSTAAKGTITIQEAIVAGATTGASVTAGQVQGGFMQLDSSFWADFGAADVDGTKADVYVFFTYTADGAGVEADDINVLGTVTVEEGALMHAGSVIA